jgi:hypothetical protein
MKDAPLYRLARLLRIPRQSTRASFSAPAEREATFLDGSRSLDHPIDRYAPDREEILHKALEAWRINPLARRIVGLTSQYVVGGGISFSSSHEPTSAFLHAFWEHPLNQLPLRLYEWCDELTRSGNLFLLVSTDAAGMSYLRAVPTAQIRTIRSRPQDPDQEVAYEMQPGGWEGTDAPSWQAYDPRQDAPLGGGGFSPVMLHFAVNRPAGAQWGESDLAPLLRWLSRYSAWLEDRARLNHFRNAFLYVVRARFTSDAERRARQSALNSSPPSPGSILVTDENEHWDTLHPRLESDEAGQDGLALKKMIAAGAGIPMHFLAEPEGATRTTAEAAGGPTYRYFEQRQRTFLWMINQVLQTVVNRRALVDPRVSRQAPIELHGADISARDNIALAMAAANLAPALYSLRDRALIDDAELLRLFYRFCGETVDAEEMLARGSKATAGNTPARQSSAPFPSGNLQAPRQQPVKLDPANGEIKGEIHAG